VAALAARLVAPIVRAGTEGVSPTTAERRRLGVLAAGALAAAGWLLGGPTLAFLAGVAGPVVAMALVRARRHRFRAALTASAPAVARALADALSAGHSVRSALGVVATGVPGAAGHELNAAVRALQFGARTEAVLERLRPRPAGRVDGSAPCLAPTVLGEIPVGARNTTLISFAGSMRRRGMSVEAILAALRVENATRCRPPLPPSEVELIAAGVGRYTPAISPTRPVSPNSTGARRGPYTFTPSGR
jgi:tight adherence protein B